MFLPSSPIKDFVKIQKDEAWRLKKYYSRILWLQHGNSFKDSGRLDRTLFNSHKLSQGIYILGTSEGFWNKNHLLPNLLCLTKKLSLGSFDLGAEPFMLLITSQGFKCIRSSVWKISWSELTAKFSNHGTKAGKTADSCHVKIAVLNWFGQQTFHVLTSNAMYIRLDSWLVWCQNSA